ncbi:MAG: hypothetical protein ABIJ39_01995 [Chloroflexota bacterium]
MSTRTKTERIQVGSWTLRTRQAEAEPVRLLLLLHGWTGDEDSMWVFVRKLSPNYCILAPRGPYPAPQGGNSWREIKPGTWGLPTVDDLRPAAEAIQGLLDLWSTHTGLEVGQIDLMGFSQGAALAYVFAMINPDRVARVAALSGFVPEGAETLITGRSLTGLSFFVAHGSQDNLITVDRARKSVRILEQAGAITTYCEDEVGHKVSSGCLKGT